MKFLKKQLEDGMLTITLNDPERNNPLSYQLCTELITVLKKAENDSDIKVIILTGQGKSFSAGADIREFTEGLEQSSVRLYENGRAATAELFCLGAKYTKPIIGAINGYALGGGFGLACLCHVAFASEKAKFGLTEINIGLFPMVVLPVVRKIIGERKALELSLSAEILKANEACKLGVINYVVPHDHLLQEVKAFAKKIVKRSPAAIKIGLTAFNETHLMESNRAINYLNSLRVVNYKSSDLYEGAKAFLEKREANWTGE
ncbi:enoyl-CoA hydratase/isomerase family protein [Alkalihalobacillus sp. BA299]|uniref:enoyl-CoA hydratase/isomerase family protein n=1 Tax=Alkalihalobacillus sp. BA299 TaxID=2815938 RepID=UPI001ADC6EC4|nr:enoyl-CoA hydratase/isomerase family protein [Alkalihalobacillus sp. BA299]